MCNVWSFLDNIAIGFPLCNTVPRVLKQHWTQFFAVQCCLEPLRQHDTRFLHMKCCPKSITKLLKSIFLCAILCGSSRIVRRVLRQHWTRFFPVQYCVEPIGQHWRKFFPVKFCLKALGQHCTKFLSVQCCPKNVRTTLNRTFLHAILSGASWITLHKASNCAILSQEY